MPLLTLYKDNKDMLSIITNGGFNDFSHFEQTMAMPLYMNLQNKLEQSDMQYHPERMPEQHRELLDRHKETLDKLLKFLKDKEHDIQEKLQLQFEKSDGHRQVFVDDFLELSGMVFFEENDVSGRVKIPVFVLINRSPICPDVIESEASSTTVVEFQRQNAREYVETTEVRFLPKELMEDVCEIHKAMNEGTIQSEDVEENMRWILNQRIAPPKILEKIRAFRGKSLPD